MRLPFFLACVVLLAVAPVEAGAEETKNPARQIVVVIWDGMRPEFVDAKYAPTLAGLARAGVIFKENRAAYPSSTNVNGAVLATGARPGRTGIVANQEFRPEIDPAGPFDTADFPALEENAALNAKYLAAPTVAELLQRAGHRTAIAGSKTVVQLFDRVRGRETEAGKKSGVVFRGRIFPPDLKTLVTAALGPFPKRQDYPNDEEDDWTTRALTEVLWKEGVPKYSVLWLSEPDLTEHKYAPGSPESLAAIQASDRNLARLLAVLKAKNALASTNIFVVSDHGFSTVAEVVEVVDSAALLRAAGFDAVRRFKDPPRRGQVLVVTVGGSVGYYVVERDPAVTKKLVEFLQRSAFAGVIFTRQPHPGTFTLEQAQMSSPGGPDVFVACRWNEEPNEFGVAGSMISEQGRVIGEGTHTTLSPHDMKNILIAAGPDLRAGWVNETPSGNIDLAPTALFLLGLEIPPTMEGRVLREALRHSEAAPKAAAQELVAEADLGSATWRQTLNLTTVGKATYLREGNGRPHPKQP